MDEWNAFNRSGLSYLNAGKWAEAEVQFVSALRSSQAIVREGSAHSSVPLYLALSNLSTAQRELGKLAESKSNAAYALSHVRALKDAVGADVLGLLHRQLGLVCELQGQWEEARDNYTQAERCFRERIDRLRAAPPPSSSSSPTSSSSSSSFSSSSFSPSDSIPALQKEHAGALFALGLAHQRLQQTDTAITYYKEALQVASTAYGADSLPVAEGHVALGRLLVEEAESGRSSRGDELRERGSAELMKALEIYQARNDPALLAVLPLYMRSVGLDENIAQQLMQQHHPPPNTVN